MIRLNFILRHKIRIRGHVTFHPKAKRVVFTYHFYAQIHPIYTPQSRPISRNLTLISLIKIESPNYCIVTLPFLPFHSPVNKMGNLISCHEYQQQSFDEDSFCWLHSDRISTVLLRFGNLRNCEKTHSEKISVFIN